MCVDIKYKSISKARHWPEWVLRKKSTADTTKIKHKFEDKVYKKLYPTDSRLGLFYGKPKVHKLQQQQQQQRLKELMMRPVISNIGMATYEIAKYLNKSLTPLNKSDYNILNTKNLIRRLREETIPGWI